MIKILILFNFKLRSCVFVIHIKKQTQTFYEAKKQAGEKLRTFCIRNF